MENVNRNHSNQRLDPVAGTFAPDADVGTTSLWGFLGPARDDMYRLYTDGSFTRFYEIPQRAIVWVETSDSDDDAVTPARVGVASGTPLDVIDTSAAAGWLGGAITTGYLQNQDASSVTAAAACTNQGGPQMQAAAPLCVTVAFHA